MVDLLCCIPGSICCFCNKDQDTAEIHKDTPKKMEAEEELTFSSRIMNSFKQYKSPVTALVVDFYSPLLQNYIVKAVVIVIFSIWFGFTVWGSTRVEDGLDIDDALPSGTVEHSFASANVRHFAAYAFTVNSKDINYTDPEIQRRLIQLSEEIKTARFVVLARGLNSYWLNLTINFYAGIELFYQGYCEKLLQEPPEDLGPVFEDFIQLFTLVHMIANRTDVTDLDALGNLIASCSNTIPPLLERVNQTVVDIPLNQPAFYIPSDRFYRYVALWVSDTYI